MDDEKGKGEGKKTDERQVAIGRGSPPNLGDGGILGALASLGPVHSVFFTCFTLSLVHQEAERRNV